MPPKVREFREPAPADVRLHRVIDHALNQLGIDGRRRLIAGTGAAIIVLLVAALAAVPAVRDDDLEPRPAARVAPGPGDRRVPATLLVTPDTPRIVTASTQLHPASAGPSPARRGNAAATCRNSTKPSCGPFRWDPVPAHNEPMSVVLTVSPARPRPYENVTFRVVAHDPDAPFGDPCPNASFGDGQQTYNCYAGSTMRGWRTCPTSSYGPWDPPAPTPGAFDWSVTHTFERTGRYTVSLNFASGRTPMPRMDGRHSCAVDPYASRGSATAIVDVQLLDV